MEFDLVGELSEGLREAIGSPLRDYNRKWNPTFFSNRELEENAPNPLNIVVRDAAGSVVGGLIGETQFAWLRVSIMAVVEGERGKGIGRRMMAMAEEEARRRGCRHIYVDTMDYQAPGFYLKLGFTLAGLLENWDSHGHAKHTFTKKIT